MMLTVRVYESFG